MKKLSLFALLTMITLTIFSCKKIEGPGGSSSITGIIHAEVYDAAGNLLYDYNVAKEDVFIIYGDEESTFDDKTKTSFDGSFKFDYLEKGNYQVFVYEKDNNVPGGKVVKLIDVEITKKKSTVELGTITIKK